MPVFEFELLIIVQLVVMQLIIELDRIGGYMTLANFLTYVKLDFKRQDKDTELTQHYNDMINWVSVQMPHSGYKFQSYVNTTVGVEDYPVPENLIYLMHPIRFLLGAGSGDEGYPMDHVSKQEYDALESNPNRTNPPKGRPRAYTLYNRRILVTPIPDLATYLFEINWTKRAVPLSATTDIPNLGSEWDEVLKQGTLARTYAGLGMLEESLFWDKKYHVMDPYGNDMPAGLCRKLLEIERDREGSAIGVIRNNNL